MTEIKRWLAEARALMARKEYALALVPIAYILRQTPVGADSSAAWRIKSQALAGLGHLEQSLEAADQAVTDQPESVAALRQRAAVHHTLKQFPEAVHDRERAAQLAPENSTLWAQLGRAQLDLGRYADAIHSYDSALDLQPTLASALAEKELTLEQLGRTREARDAYDRARRVIPASDPLYIWVLSSSAVVSLDAGQWEEAQELAEQATTCAGTPEEHARSWTIAGTALLRRHHDEEALARYEQACEIDPDYADGWHGKGSALTHLARYEEALAALDEALRLNPSNAKARMARQEAQARALLAKTPPLDPEAPEFAQVDDMDVWKELLWEFYAARRIRDLEVAAAQIMRLEPGNGEGLTGRFTAQLLRGRFRQAAATARQWWRALRHGSQDRA